MYETYYGLNKKPFQITTDPTFLWMGTKHRDALATLKYSVMDNKGCLLLAGDVGTGKTTLINRLIKDVKDKVYTAKISDPRLTKYDFYRLVSRFFKLPIEVRTKEDFLDPFKRFLKDARLEKKPVLLLIDEAQRIKQNLLEEIRYLSNLEADGEKLLNIFFVGQQEIVDILQAPQNRALMRRVTTTYTIQPLTREEIGFYIGHRLKVGGVEYEIFSASAIDEVFDFSNGFPRQINIICDLAMLFASQMDRRTINSEVIRQCRKRISFSAPTSQKAVDIPRATPPAPPEPMGETTQPVRSVFRRVAATVGIALLLGCLGLYVAPPQWKTIAHQWLQHLFRLLGQ